MTLLHKGFTRFSCYLKNISCFSFKTI